MANDALQKAITHLGSQQALADKLGVRQSLIWYWLERSKRGVPAEYAIAIEEATGRKVTRRELRPDLWPKAARAAA